MRAVRFLLASWCLASAVACAAPLDLHRLNALVEGGQAAELRQALATQRAKDLPLEDQARLLTSAIAKGQAESLAALLDWGVDANLRLRFTLDAEQVTLSALMFALHLKAPLAVVETLVAHGAPVNLPGEVNYPLGAALSLRRLDAAGWLLDHGANPNLATSAQSMTPLMELAMSFPADDAAAVDFCRRLLAKGALANARTERGITALRLAVFKGNLALVQTLLDAQADPNLADAKGETPLQLAERKQFDAIVALLRQRGAKP